MPQARTRDPEVVHPADYSTIPTARRARQMRLNDFLAERRMRRG